MKHLILAFGIFLAFGAVSTPAQAQNYPWCADYAKGGDTNCAFVTYEQCMATLSGLGGFCNRNTQYHPPAGPHSNPRHR
jgi:hypothetical protein